MSFVLNPRYKSTLAVILGILVVLGIVLFALPERNAEEDVVAESWGTLLGTVMLGPTCPVVMDPPDPSCADRPFETKLAITTADQSRVLKEVTSDGQGRFRIDLPPGTYSIRSAAAANILPYCALDGIVVPINETVEVTVNCDSGIR